MGVAITCPKCSIRLTLASDRSDCSLNCPQCEKFINLHTLGLVGQDRLKETIIAKITAAKRERRILPHMLLCAPPTSGKKQFAHMIAMDMDAAIQYTDCNELEKPADLLPFLTNTENGSILLLSQIDKLQPSLAEFLLPALQRFQVEIEVGEKDNRRIVRAYLKQFTLIATTNRFSRVNRKIIPWLAIHHFEPFSRTEVENIIRILGETRFLEFTSDATKLLFDRSNGRLEKADIICTRIDNYLGKDQNREINSVRLDEILAWLGYGSDNSQPLVLFDSLQAMSGTEFEEHVAHIFRGDGYEVTFTEVTGDHGIDLLLRRDGRMFAVQCKRWKGSVGEPEIRDFYGSLIAIGAEHGYFVTTGNFTAQAVSFAANKPIRLIDTDALMQMSRRIDKSQIK